jgi:adenosylhomocysteine nucleosidase
MNIGLVAEVKWEVRAVCRRLHLRPIAPHAGLWGANLNGQCLRLCLSGMIPTMARERVLHFVEPHPLDLMICSGLAGALRPEVAVGDLIVQSTGPALVRIAEQALKDARLSFHVGPLVTVAKPVLTRDTRQELAARSQAIAVDMESQTIAALCRERGIPCLALKAVSDGIEDDLSPILGGFDIIHIPRIAWWVLSRPATWPLAGRLARHSYLAATNLGDGVWATLTRLESPRTY